MFVADLVDVGEYRLNPITDLQLGNRPNQRVNSALAAIDKPNLQFWAGNGNNQPGHAGPAAEVNDFNGASRDSVSEPRGMANDLK